MSAQNKATDRIAKGITIAILASALALAGCGQAAPTPAPPAPSAQPPLGTATQPAPPAPTATQPPPTLAQAQPGEVPVSAFDDIAGTWIGQVSDGTMRVVFENNGHFRIQMGTTVLDRGSASIEGGKLTFHSERPDSQASGSYMIYLKKQAGQVAQLHFVLISDESDERGSDLGQKIFQFVK
jgi:hypothetical protein